MVKKWASKLILRSGLKKKQKNKGHMKMALTWKGREESNRLS